MFRWLDDEEEIRGYALSIPNSSVKKMFVSANMGDNNNDDDLQCRIEA